MAPGIGAGIWARFVHFRGPGCDPVGGRVERSRGQLRSGSVARATRRGLPAPGRAVPWQGPRVADPAQAPAHGRGRARQARRSGRPAGSRRRGRPTRHPDGRPRPRRRDDHDGRDAPLAAAAAVGRRAGAPSAGRRRPGRAPGLGATLARRRARTSPSAAWACPASGSRDRITVQIDPTRHAVSRLQPRRPRPSSRRRPRRGCPATQRRRRRGQARGGGVVLGPASRRSWPIRGPGRLAGRARASCPQAPDGQEITGPRLQTLQDIASAYGTDILRETVGTRVSPALVARGDRGRERGAARTRCPRPGRRGSCSSCRRPPRDSASTDRLEAAEIDPRRRGLPRLAARATSAATRSSPSPPTTRARGRCDDNGGVPPYARDARLRAQGPGRLHGGARPLPDPARARLGRLRVRGGPGAPDGACRARPSCMGRRRTPDRDARRQARRATPIRVPRPGSHEGAEGHDGEALGAGVGEERVEQRLGQALAPQRVGRRRCGRR